MTTSKMVAGLMSPTLVAMTAAVLLNLGEVSHEPVWGRAFSCSSLGLNYLRDSIAHQRATPSESLPL
jgi:hypothetical protein